MNCLTFGKYKGLPIRTVAIGDPKYLQWAIDNVEGFTVPQEVLDIAEELANAMDACKSAWSSEDQDCSNERMSELIEKYSQEEPNNE